MSVSMLALSPVSIGCQKKVNYTILWGDAGTTKARSTGNRSWWCWNSQCDQWDQQVISICPQNNIDFSLLIFHELQWLTVRSVLSGVNLACESCCYIVDIAASLGYTIFVLTFLFPMFKCICCGDGVYHSKFKLPVSSWLFILQLHFDVYKSRKDVSSFYLLWNQFLVYWLKNCELFFSCTDRQSSCLHCPEESRSKRWRWLGRMTVIQFQSSEKKRTPSYEKMLPSK
jgi:hypothetical protein